MVIIGVIDGIIKDWIVFSVMGPIWRAKALINNMQYKANGLLDEPVNGSASPKGEMRTNDSHGCEQRYQVIDNRMSCKSVFFFWQEKKSNKEVSK